MSNAAPPPLPTWTAAQSEAWTLTERRLLCYCTGEQFTDRADNLDTIRAAGIDADSFYSPAHREVFTALCALRDARHPLDVPTLAASLSAEKLYRVGGLLWLAQLGDTVPTSLWIKRDTDAAKEAAARRKAREALLVVIDAVINNKAELPELAPMLKTAADLAAGIGQLKAPPLAPLWCPSQFLEYVPPPNHCLLGDAVIERGEITSLVGAGGLGKSRLATAFALAWLTGRDWCGLPTRGGPGNVLFIGCENSTMRWQTDLRRMIENGSFTDAELETIDRHLRAPSSVGGDIPMHLGDGVACDYIRAALDAHKPALVFFDPFASMVDGDENSAEDMGRTLRTLRGLVATAAPGAAVVLIHHARTGSANVAQAGDNFNAGNFGRGSKALYSAVRSELQLAPADKDDPNKLTLAHGKSNNGPRFETRGLIFNPDTFAYAVDPSFDVEAWRNDVAGKRTSKACSVADVVEIVRELAPSAGTEASTRAIFDTAHERGMGSERTVRTRLNEAVAAQYLRSGKKGFYRLGAKPLNK